MSVLRNGFPGRTYMTTRTQRQGSRRPPPTTLPAVVSPLLTPPPTGAFVRKNAITDSMGQLVVRKVEEVVIRALRREAAKNGRSAEAQHREILRRHLLAGAKGSLKAHLLSMPGVGDDVDFEVPRPKARRVRL